MNRIVVIGAGGHARSVCDILMRDSENEIVGLIDKPGAKGFWGLEVLGDDECLPELLKEGLATHAFVALGDNRHRRKLAERLCSLGYLMVNAISPHAVISAHACLGRGIALMPGAIIGPNAVIGDGSVVNTNASVDHDAKIGPFCHIAPGSTLCGTVCVADEVFVGAGARVIDSVSIGEGSIIGSGAAVVRDIPAHCTAVGVPARVIKYH